MYSNKSEQERYFIFNTLAMTLFVVVLLLSILIGQFNAHQTGDNTHKTSIACVKSGGSWKYKTNDDANKWECIQ